MTTSHNSDEPGHSRPEPAVTAAFEPSRSAAELLRVLDDYLADLQAGKPPDRAAVLAAHPQLAGQLDQCLAGMEFIHRAGRTAGEMPAQLGDFRICREIGRGGMGVVFEAEQLSLHRTVALKILRFGVADKEALERFRYEAETVAKLHHTNIVPIFAIGCEQGVNFYAMQYIPGRSLGDVIEQRLASRRAAVSREPQSPLAKAGTPTLSDIAGWGLQAAEALAHAHSRGVIHRDIKPSNLLLDDEGTLWLTDFGLAKRMDEVTMTLTGAILGTPRYMSPEQAAASRQPVDHRTDIYSLGATLYELVTGQPVFAAATPHEVISQIITAEPKPPRHFDRSLPRDLETIVLKCLAKEPAGRYQTAHELTDDLRAFLGGRPIAARRLGVVARAARWVKMRRKTAIAMAAAAACGAALLVGGLLAWRMHEESLLGHVSLSTSGPTLIADVLDKDGRPAAPSFPVPSSQQTALPEGSYQVRLSSPGMLSQTYRLDIDRGSQLTFDLQLEDRWLWPPMELNPDDHVEPVQFGERTDLFVYRDSAATLRRLDGATGQPVWSKPLTFDQSNLPKGEDLEEWSDLLHGYDNHPWQQLSLAQSPVDLDGDGVRDLVFGSQRRRALIAISGKTGKVLWLFRGQTEKETSGSEPVADSRMGVVIGRPVIAPSAGDEGARIVACFYSGGERYQQKDGSIINMGPETWLEAISGKSGKRLWRYRLHEYPKLELDSASATLKTTEQPQIAHVGGRDVVVSAINTALYVIDLETGKEVWSPYADVFTLDAAPRIVDLGHGESAALVYGAPRPQAIAHGLKPSLQSKSLANRGSANPGLGGWTQEIGGLNRRGLSPVEFDVAPLGPKDAPALIDAIPHKGAASGEILSGIVRARPGVDILVLDARTGHQLWEKVVFSSPYEPSPIRWLVGPDLDGDGYRELFVAWIADQPGGSQFVVAAFSGRDGRTLWRWPLDGVVQDLNPQSPMCWWQAAENGWPLLVVPVSRSPGRQPATYILDSATGQLRHTLLGVSDGRTYDLNGDGLADLLYTTAPQGAPRLMALRGEPPVAWRRFRQEPLMAEFTAAAAEDFNDDGITDAIVRKFDGTLAAINGRDGRTLWRIASEGGNGDLAMLSPPLQKGGSGPPCVLRINDGVNSTIGKSQVQLRVYSAADGRRLWSSAVAPTLLWDGYPSALAVCPLDRRGPADILATVTPTANGGAGGSESASLNVLAGDSGQSRWNVLVDRAQFTEVGKVYRSEFQDLNGDGVADIVVWTRTSGKPDQPLELKAISGIDGTPLWHDVPPIRGQPLLANWFNLPTLADLEGKGDPVVLVVRQRRLDSPDAEFRARQRVQTPAELVAVGGRDGRIKWTWPWLNAVGDSLPPLAVDFDGSGRRLVCQVIQEWSSDTLRGHLQLALLDGAGKLRRKIPLSPRRSASDASWEAVARWLRKVDLNGDGKESLLVYTDDKPKMLGADLEAEWTWPVPIDEQAHVPVKADLVDILPAEGGKPATVVVWAGKSVFGLSAATGRPRWRGEMLDVPPPNSRSDRPDPRPERVLLRDRNGPGLPRLLANESCRLTWPVDQQGRYQPPRGEPLTYATLDEPVRDRPLPWAPGQFGFSNIVFLLQIVPWTLVWLVVPVLLIRWAMKRNSWRLAFVPALYQLAMTLGLKIVPVSWLPFNTPQSSEWDPHVWMCLLSAVFLIVHAVWMLRRRLWALVDASAIYAIAIAIGWSQRLTPLANDYDLHLHYFATSVMTIPISIVKMLSVVFGGLPLIAAIVFIAIWLRRRQWIRLGLFIVATVVFADRVAALQLREDRSKMGADQVYVWDGWYLIFVFGVYLAGWLVLLGWLLKVGFPLVRHAVAWIHSRFSRKAVA